MKLLGKNPLYTNYTEHFKGCIDYIYVSKNIKVEDVNDIDKLVKDLTKENEYLPNEKFPSDHMYLVADLVI
jgi:mRNA deadenylase 3'-5' endonuclease subunit Ccr4